MSATPIQARERLHEDARACRKRGMSAYEWTERVEDAEDAEIIGTRQLQAIVNLVWQGTGRIW